MKKNKIIIQICGGLGNQLFQYLFAISKFDLDVNELYFDISDNLDPNNPKKFVLDQLGFKGNFIFGDRSFYFRDSVEYARLKNIRFLSDASSINEVSKIEGRIFRETEKLNNISFSKAEEDQFYFGYWQSPSYWNNSNKILSDAIVSISKSAYMIQVEEWKNSKLPISDKTCAVHIRGEDYLKFLDYHGVCEREYYSRAFLDFKGSKFHIYTNDLAHAQKIIPHGYEVEYISDYFQDDLLEFVLLTQYQNYIIPNSSYSYLAAMLSRERSFSQTVIAPYPWYSFAKDGPEYPIDWKLLNRATGNTYEEDIRLIESSKISVIMPVYKRHEFLESALLSVYKQTRLPDEIFISQNASSDSVKDEVKRLARKYPLVKILETESPNSLSFARNVAIQNSSGNFLTFLDDDDVWVPEKLEIQIKSLVLQGATVCASNFHEINMFGEFQWSSTYSSSRGASWANLLTYENSFSGGSAAMVRAEVFHRVGMFDINLPSCEDHDMWRRMAIAGEKLLFLENDLVGIRKAGGNMSTNLMLRLRGELIHLSKMLNSPMVPLKIINAYYSNLRSALNEALAQPGDNIGNAAKSEDEFYFLNKMKPSFYFRVREYHHLSLLKQELGKFIDNLIKKERLYFENFNEGQDFSIYLKRKIGLIVLVFPIEIWFFIQKNFLSMIKKILK